MVRRNFLQTALMAASALFLAGCDAAFSALNLVVPRSSRNQASGPADSRVVIALLKGGGTCRGTTGA